MFCLMASSVIFFNNLESVYAYTEEFEVATIEMQEDNGNGDVVLFRFNV